MNFSKGGLKVLSGIAYWYYFQTKKTKKKKKIKIKKKKKKRYPQKNGQMNGKSQMHVFVSVN